MWTQQVVFKYGVALNIQSVVKVSNLFTYSLQAVLTSNMAAKAAAPPVIWQLNSFFSHSDCSVLKHMAVVCAHEELIC